MNIIELAKEAGFGYIGFPPEEGEWVCKESGLERFAALVRAEALEEAAKWFEANGANMMTKPECAAAIRRLK